MGSISGDVNTGSSRCLTPADLASRPVGSRQTGDMAYVESLEADPVGPYFFFRRGASLPASSSVIVPSGSGGADGRWLSFAIYGGAAAASVTTIDFASRAAISSFDTTTVVGTIRAHTTNVDASFEYIPSSILTVDGVNVLAATPTGRWHREQVAIYAYTLQGSWTLDYTAGNDEAAGTIGAPIKTIAEYEARTQGVVDFSTALQLVGTVWPATDKFHYPVLFRAKAANTAGFAISGTRTVSRSSVTTSASTNPVTTLGSQEFATITDTSVGSWAADVGKLIVAANGARAWILKDLTGGKARVTAWSAVTGATAPAPPSGTAYSVVTLTQVDVILGMVSPLDQVQIIDCEIRNGLRSSTSKTQWLGCKFTAAQVVGAWMGNFEQCLMATGGGVWRLSADTIGATVSNPSVLMGSCGFLNTSLVLGARGYMQLQDTVFEVGYCSLGDLPYGHSGIDGCVSAVFSGTYGVAFFDAPASNPAVLVDGNSTLFLSESLFGAGNLGIGTQIRRDSKIYVKAIVPTLQSVGTELSVPAGPIPNLAPGSAVPASPNTCSTWALAAAYAGGAVFTTTERCVIQF